VTENQNNLLPQTPLPQPKSPKPKSWQSRLRFFLRWTVLAVASLWLFAVLLIVALRWIDPPTTAVHIERRIQAIIHGKPYDPRYQFVPLSQISPQLQHAVIASEDARFYLHHGFDWHAIELAAEDDMEGARMRGGSTITQQLVKNLFFGTGRSFLRKGGEFTLVPVAELVLGKQRILELYLNVIEWGPGIYGAEAACRYWDKTSARAIGRQQSALLVSIIPNPRKRRPERMTHHSQIVLRHMEQVGW
jgi:monofunctional biosynthetic peptidoglycan transglycosylase